jgi:hypothetical protein
MALVTLSRSVSKMSRAALICCSALALVLSPGIAHAQQGNLPRPVQKLPTYPPVVCVTPDWRLEACEDRNASLALPTFPALPLLNSRNTPRHIECIKPAEPGWFGLGGLFQLLDCTWLGWTEEVKPFDGRWPAPKVVEPITQGQESCRQIDNCALVETALDGLFETLPVFGIEVRPTIPPIVTVLYSYGGVLPTHDARWREVASLGGPVKIFGPCNSGCTIVVAHIPKHRLCFGPNGVLGFHQSRIVFNGTDLWMTDPAGTQWMIDQYPDDIRHWIKTKGGIKKMTVENMWTLPASELWKMGYSKCND